MVTFSLHKQPNPVNIVLVKPAFIASALQAWDVLAHSSKPGTNSWPHHKPTLSVLKGQSFALARRKIFLVLSPAFLLLEKQCLRGVWWRIYLVIKIPKLDCTHSFGSFNVLSVVLSLAVTEARQLEVGPKRKRILNSNRVGRWRQTERNGRTNQLFKQERKKLII